MKSIQSDPDERALMALRANIKLGDTVFTILRHVSTSHLSRRISVHTFPGFDESGRLEIRTWDHNVAALGIGRQVPDKQGIHIEGMGQDMGFHIVYEMGRSLFPEGFTCPGKNCNSNDHRNGDRNYKRHHHNDGGYAFRHRWI